KHIQQIHGASLSWLTSLALRVSPGAASTAPPRRPPGPGGVTARGHMRPAREKERAAPTTRFLPVSDGTAAPLRASPARRPLSPQATAVEPPRPPTAAAPGRIGRRCGRTTVWCAGSAAGRALELAPDPGEP